MKDSIQDITFSQESCENDGPSPQEDDDSSIEDNSRISEDSEDEENVAEDSWKSATKISYDGGNSSDAHDDDDQDMYRFTIEGRKPLHDITNESLNRSGIGEKGYCSSASLLGRYSILLTIVAVLVIYLLSLFNASSAVKAYDAEQFLTDMEKDYPKYVNYFKVYVKQLDRSILNKRIEDQNVIYTLLHSNEAPLANTVAKKMASFGAQMLNGSGQAYVIDGTAVKDNPSGFNLTKIRKRATEERALIVYNLEEMPLEEIKFFHAICDRYSPFTDKPVVVITILKIPRFQSATSFMEKLLKYFSSVWPGLDDAYRNPLFIRLTENIIRI